MKKLVALFLALTLCLSLCACGNNGGAVSTDTSANSSKVENVSSTASQSESQNSSLSEIASSKVTSVDSASQTPSTTQTSSTSSTTSTTSSTTSVTSSAPVHTHTYSAATCTEPQKCSCGETKGTALGHKWAAATCTAPKTCSVCKTTEGAALGHKWAAATCTAPKTCSVCKVTEGKALGHKFTNGKCSVCNTKDPDFKDLEDGYWNANIEFPKYLTTITLTFGGEEPYYGYSKSRLADLEGENVGKDNLYEYNGKTYWSSATGDADVIDYAVSGNDIIVKYDGKQMTLKRISNTELKITQADAGFLNYGDEESVAVGAIFKFEEFSDEDE